MKSEGGTIRPQCGDEGIVREFLEFGSRGVFPIFGNDSLNMAFLGTAFEACSCPGGCVETAGGVDIDVSKAVGGEVVLLFLGKGGAVRRNAVDEDLAESPVTHERHVVVFFWPAGFLEEHGTSAGATADVNERGDDFVSEVFEQHGVAILSRLNVVDKTDIPAAAVVGIAAGVDVKQRVNGDIVNVAQTVGVDLELGAVRANAHNTAAEHGEHSVVCAFCLVHAIVTDGDIDPAVNRHAHAIGSVVCATALVVRLAADIGDKYLGRAVGFAVFVLVLKNT